MAKMRRKEKPRELTPEEIRMMVVNHVHGIVDYWDKVENKDTREKLDGVAFSILSMFDGSVPHIPPFIVAPATDKEWKKHFIAEGMDYFPNNYKVFRKVQGNISGSLHDEYSAFGYDKIEDDDK